ncbi:hypothetical protein E4U40_001828 [Claviceps sp. LM458 group G5]|nr:hypothetical protein E4U40_001828 [Claviceps sp. LM458 group G5]
MKFKTLSAMMCFLEVALGASISALWSRHVKLPRPAGSPYIPSWNVAIEPGQKDMIVVNGTIEHVDAYMEAHYPGWSTRLANVTRRNPVRLGPASLPELMAVKKIKCNHFHDQCLMPPLLTGLKHLRTISKDRHLRNGPSPRVCGMISCSNDGAFILCNDADKPKTLDHFTDLAFGGQTVVQKCTMGKRHPRVAGKVFFFGGFSIIARQWNCDTEWPSSGHKP